MFGRIPLSVLLALALVFPAGAGGKDPLGPGILGALDHRQPVFAEGWPWSAIGRVNRAGGGFCTGTLVAADRVITAAHCLYDPRGRRWVHPHEMHFLAGYRLGDYAAHRVAREIRRDPRYGTGQGAAGLPYDWAVLILDHGLEQKPIATGAATNGARILRAGYGQDRPHLLSKHDGCRIEGHLGTVLIHNCDAVHGDSGSPMLVFENGIPKLVGIHVAVVNGTEGAAVSSSAFAAALGGPE